MHQPVTQNQVRSTECQPKVFLLQFEKRIDSRASAFFKSRQKTKNLRLTFGFYSCNITFRKINNNRTADFGKFDPKPSDQNM